MRKIALLAWVFAAAFLVTSCGKEISPQQTGATKVEGTDGLYAFCHGPMLVYFTDISGSDDIVEAVWPGLCVKQGDEWVLDFDAIAKGSIVNGNADDN